MGTHAENDDHPRNKSGLAPYTSGVPWNNPCRHLLSPSCAQTQKGIDTLNLLWSIHYYRIGKSYTQKKVPPLTSECLGTFHSIYFYTFLDIILVLFDIKVSMLLNLSWKLKSHQKVHLHSCNQLSDLWYAQVCIVTLEEVMFHHRPSPWGQTKNARDHSCSFLLKT